MEYFENLHLLLKSELNADQLQFNKSLAENSIEKRRNEGLVWYPVAIRSQELGRGDYLSVEFERTTHQDIVHQIRFGAPVSLFNNHENPKLKLEGTVSHQSQNKVKITFKTDELPEWASKGKLGIELNFDNVSYQEMFDALKQAPLSSLAPYCTGSKKPKFENLINLQLKNLNNSQNEAVNKILNAEHVAIVHGPPGTGKTTTLVSAIQQLIKKGKILVTAPSNTAVDLLSLKLLEKGINVLRIGNPIRVSEKLDQITLEGRIAQHPEFKNIKKLKIQANEYRNLAHKYKRHFGKSERDQRKALFNEAHKILDDISKIEDYILEKSIENAEVITATLVGCNHYTIKNLKYHAVVIDEAAQALEPASWIPILKSEKLILAGDHCQLPPTIKSEISLTQGLEKTLFEKLIELQPEAVSMLNIQYRMNKDIMRFPSQIFYNDLLKAHPNNADSRFGINIPNLIYVDTAGCGFEEKSENTSVVNKEEAEFIVKQLYVYISNSDTNKTFALISPYSQQVKLLKELVQSTESLKPFLTQINVNTIDSFQGQERDAVFISLVRSNSEGNIGFLSDIRRMNVAMTRAKTLLYIVGDSSTICSNDFYYKFVNFTQQNNFYKSAWEFINV